MSMKQVDIILISYNQEPFIRQAIRSIFMQRLPDDWKANIIIADDCSQDRTLSIIREEETNSPFSMQYLESEHNLGHPQNYKRAFAACQGDYVAILEGDDYWTDTLRLQKHITFLEQHREAVLTMNDYYEYYQATGRFDDPHHGRPAIDYFTGQQTARGNVLGNLSACVIRNEVLQQLPSAIYDTDVDDWLLGLTLSDFGFLVVFGEKMSVYRLHPASQWSGLDRAKQIEIDMARADRYDRLTQGKYHAELEFFKRLVQGKNVVPWRKWLSRCTPPIIKWIIKLIVPPVWYQK